MGIEMVVAMTSSCSVSAVPSVTRNSTISTVIRFLSAVSEI